MTNLGRKARLVLVSVLSICLTVALLLIVNTPRKLEHQALVTLSELEEVVREGASQRLMQLVVLPAVMNDRSETEKTRLMLEILGGEVTPEGIESLRENGECGTLQDVFPEEARKWTDPVRVDPALCVAFRLDGPEFRSEVVLVNQEDRMRVLRCNDVR